MASEQPTSFIEENTHINSGGGREVNPETLCVFVHSTNYWDKNWKEIYY